ncbi:hypothetical protein BGZ94_005366 [Podila epigama]|nr:hypothetical protein BGZ94_005366 [Podila epigama]
MAVKKNKRATSKRKKAPVTVTATTGTATGVAKAMDKKALLTAATAAATVDPVSVLLAMTPSGAETTSSTSSLLTVKSTKKVAQKKSSMATAQLIRRYHTLNKELSKCLARIEANKSASGSNSTADKTHNYHQKVHIRQGSQKQQEQIAADMVRIAEIRQEMDDLGGLDMYQKASTLGQSKQRGGDSSKWFIPILESCHPDMNKKVDPPLRLLDVGALSPHNYQKYSSWIHTTPIDLNPQDPLITKMDFLEMPVPSKENMFDVVCLSLVVNFVGDPTQRGEILRQATRFLKPKMGLLYLVLPLPCIDNSRYMDHELLVEMMAYLGFTTLIRHHFAKKLAYYVFRFDTSSPSPTPTSSNHSHYNKASQPRFPKKMRHDKPNRNK